MSNVLLKTYFWKILANKILNGSHFAIRNSGLTKIHPAVIMLPDILVLVFVTMLQMKQIYLGEMSQKELFVNGTNGETAITFWIAISFIHFFLSGYLKKWEARNNNNGLFWPTFGISTFLSSLLLCAGLYSTPILLSVVFLLLMISGIHHVINDYLKSIKDA